MLDASGTDALIKAFVANDIPPIVNQWVSITEPCWLLPPLPSPGTTSSSAISPLLSSASKQAQDQHANAVVVSWITQAITTSLI